MKRYIRSRLTEQDAAQACNPNNHRAGGPARRGAPAFSSACMQRAAAGLRGSGQERLSGLEIFWPLQVQVELALVLSPRLRHPNIVRGYRCFFDLDSICIFQARRGPFLVWQHARPARQRAPRHLPCADVRHLRPLRRSMRRRGICLRSALASRCAAFQRSQS